VVIFNEMIHEPRMVRLDGRPHPGSNIRQWMGDSRGRWEGGTLVVDTVNVTGKTSFRRRQRPDAPDRAFHPRRRGYTDLRIHRRLPGGVHATADAAIPMSKSDELVYDYACHEGNDSLEHALAGARNQEKAAAEDAAGKGAR
jgi:hypothetical protein